MKKIWFYLAVILLPLFGEVKAQNLVLNPSFENLTIDCCDYPLGTNPYLMLQSWTNANTVPLGSSADLFHECLSCVIPSYSLENLAFGKQFPRTGFGFSGQFAFALFDSTIISNDYIQGELFVSLEAGKKYTLCVNVSLGEKVNYTLNNFGILFSATKLDEHTTTGLFNYFPQIVFNEYITERESWKKYSFEYVAQGGEKFFVFGNFEEPAVIDTQRILCSDYDSLHPNECYDICYLYFDDISVFKADAPVFVANAGEDQLICAGESTTLGSPSREQYLYWWYDEDGNLVSTESQVTVFPSASTYFILRMKDFKFDESSDTVYVYVGNCENPLYVPNVFSPNGDGINDILWVRGEGIKEISNFSIFNRWGGQLHDCSCHEYDNDGLCCGWNGMYKNKEVPAGVYVYFVEAILLNGQTVKKQGSVTIVR